ncbi:MAG TPA: tRNA (adenosine(37)-N6)-threonylcarbamoyltransferase complex ATPase subunit type 1 TsaE [Aggregatilineales bacterium]|nr:tRNA (adenosine(37)-N6)-threonylcarbamoyltransferase complex ATPase subunit type 1 TsaE [Anaerolineales bacterium]HRE47827.1 tRNA (adenosine(37)-N6)-threonylcarbamoyltransferase complex ATPase subunit type 1 TsaE [Aggregatilineales bacterium]
MIPPPVETLLLNSASREATLAIGVQIGRLLSGGEVICLSGDLGAGKTALAVGIGAGWGVSEAVHSPTFVFVHEHRRASGERLYHIDAYRLRGVDDAESIGLEDIIGGDDPVLLEWAERVAVLIPSEALWIRLEAQAESPDERAITLSASVGRGLFLLRRLAETHSDKG